MSAERWLIAGLGNPGPEYAGTRHNLGYQVADELAGRIGTGFRRHRSRAQIAEGVLAGRPVTLAKPMSFMNASGGPVAALCAFYKITPDRVVVVHDELDLPFGVIRLKLGGGDNGHNGLRSVTSSLHTREYFRVRLGIGRPPGRQDPAAFLLRDFGAAERQQVPGLVADGADAVTVLLAEGLATAQNQVHAAQPPAAT